MQVRFKESSVSRGLIMFKILTGSLVGLTLALVLRQFFGVGNFGFTFVIVACIGIFLKLSKAWKYTGVLLFNLFCVMTAMLLRMYILVAPGQ